MTTPTIAHVCERVYPQMRYLLRQHRDPREFAVVVDPETWAAMHLEAREEEERASFGTYWRSGFGLTVEPRIFGLLLKDDGALKRDTPEKPKIVLRYEVEA